MAEEEHVVRIISPGIHPTFNWTYQRRVRVADPVYEVVYDDDFYAYLAVQEVVANVIKNSRQKSPKVDWCKEGF